MLDGVRTADAAGVIADGDRPRSRAEGLQRLAQ